MREIVLDTETTGLDPQNGDRVVEIGCVEIVNCISTGAVFHVHINPERDMPAEAEAIHGLSSAFLADKPIFLEIAEKLLEFIGDARLIIHNAGFDIGFLNAELDRLKLPTISRERIVDTLALARRRHPGGPNRLDDLCARYGIDNSHRTKHGALLDAELLAEVYAELIGGRQARLGLDQQQAGVLATKNAASRARVVPLAPRLSADELKAHRAMTEKLGADSVWSAYLATRKASA
jgi:DNA polymerase III subunit epsilon